MAEREEPRRVLMTADAVGGVFTYVLRLGALLAERGVSVHVATMGPLPTEAQRRAASQAGVELYESRYRLEWMPGAWGDVDKAGRWLLDIERELVPDIVQINGYCHASLPFRAPIVVVAHSCVLSWWKAVLSEEAPPEWGEYRARVRKGIHAADLVIAPTLAMLGCIRDEYGAPAAATVIHHAGEPDVFAPAPKEPFVLSAGRLWDQAKNVSALAKVARMLPFPIYVAGNHRPASDGPTPELDGLRLLGALPKADLADWMSRASVYALPARYEPFGLSILEAALSGCALVLGDIPSLRELWEGAALFVGPEDSHGLEVALSKLMMEPEACVALSARSREKALALSGEAMLLRHLDAYRQVLERRRAPHLGPGAGDACV